MLQVQLEQAVALLAGLGSIAAGTVAEAGIVVGDPDNMLLKEEEMVAGSNLSLHLCSWPEEQSVATDIQEERGR